MKSRREGSRRDMSKMDTAARVAVPAFDSGESALAIARTTQSGRPAPGAAAAASAGYAGGGRAAASAATASAAAGATGAAASATAGASAAGAAGAAAAASATAGGGAAAAAAAAAAARCSSMAMSPRALTAHRINSACRRRLLADDSAPLPRVLLREGGEDEDDDIERAIERKIRK